MPAPVYVVSVNISSPVLRRMALWSTVRSGSSDTFSIMVILHLPTWSILLIKKNPAIHWWNELSCWVILCIEKDIVLMLSFKKKKSDSMWQSWDMKEANNSLYFHWVCDWPNLYLLSVLIWLQHLNFRLKSHFSFRLWGHYYLKK